MASHGVVSAGFEAVTHAPSRLAPADSLGIGQQVVHDVSELVEEAGSGTAEVRHTRPSMYNVESAHVRHHLLMLQQRRSVRTWPLEVGHHSGHRNTLASP